MRGLGVYTGLMRRFEEDKAGPPPYLPTMDFRDRRNSMYVVVISAFVG